MTSLLRIIASFIITYYYIFLLLDCYDAVLSRIITSFFIPYYYIFCYYTVITSLLRIITKSMILPIIMISLLHIITSSSRHYSKWGKQVIISSLLRFIHFPYFHYYIVIADNHHCCPLSHVTNRATCRWTRNIHLDGNNKFNSSAFDFHSDSATDWCMLHQTYLFFSY